MVAFVTWTAAARTHTQSFCLSTLRKRERQFVVVLLPSCLVQEGNPPDNQSFLVARKGFGVPREEQKYDDASFEITSSQIV